MRGFEGVYIALVDGEGSKLRFLFTRPRIGSTGIHLASGRENTSVQKTGGVVKGSGEAAQIELGV